MTGRLLDLSRGLNGKQRITLELDGDFRARFDKLKEKSLDIDLKQHREQRSVRQNSYYRLLISKLATALLISEPHAHNLMLRKYGQLLYINENLVYVVLPDTDATAKELNEKEEYHVKPTSEVKTGKDGKMWRTYLMLRGSSDLDTAEMTRLIEGTIQEARDLGLDTDTPEEIERLRSLWAQAERRR